jgi:hypothetical protein
VFEFGGSAVGHYVFLADSEIVIEVSPVDVEAVIGIYEPAAECRTIYVEPDDNVLYIPYEERQIDIAC